MSLFKYTFIKVKENRDGKVITDSYYPNNYKRLPSIGHTNVNHAPDDSNVTFDMRQKLNKNDQYSVYYDRSNTREYVIASKEILNYLLNCRSQAPIEDDVWRELSGLLADGFMTSYKDVARLSIHWKKFFPDFQFEYNNDIVLQSMLVPCNDGPAANLSEALERQGISAPVYKVKSMNFYHYNVLADQLRTAVNGEAFADVAWEAFKQDIDAKAECFGQS